MLLLFLVGFGLLVAGAWNGIFVGHNGTLSLSHTVTVVWSVLILSTMLVVLALRLGAEPPTPPSSPHLQFDLPSFEPFNIHIDESLTYVMGIALGSYGGAKAIAVHRANVRNRPDTVARFVLESEGPQLVAQLREQNIPLDTARTLVRTMSEQMSLQTSLGTIRSDPSRLAHNAGLLSAGGPQNRHVRHAQTAVELLHQRTQEVVGANRHPQPARPSLGDLVGRAGGGAQKSELGKAQWVLFTFVAMVGFCFAVWRALDGDPCIDQLNCIESVPPLPAGLVSLIVASGAGYVGSKLS